MATTPAADCASVSVVSLAIAPRALKAPVYCMFSYFTYTWAPVARDKPSDRSVGVRTMRSLIRARVARTASAVRGFGLWGTVVMATDLSGRIGGNKQANANNPILLKNRARN